MQTSEKGRKRLALEEGTVLRVYHDQAGIPTVCTGHVVLPQDWAILEDGVTPAECDDFLQGDLAKAEAVVNKYVKVPMTQNQFDSLVSMQFNTGALPNSTILKRFNDGDLYGAADAFLMWIKRRDPASGGLVVDRFLVARRQREKMLFLLPDETTDERVDYLLGPVMALQFDLRDQIDWRPLKDA
jgi:lysozyme